MEKCPPNTVFNFMTSGGAEVVPWPGQLPEPEGVQRPRYVEGADPARASEASVAHRGQRQRLLAHCQAHHRHQEDLHLEYED